MFCLVVPSRARYNAFMADYMRSPIVAGTFYPDQPDRLTGLIENFMAAEMASAHVALPSTMGLILPHAGYMYSGRVAAAGLTVVARYGRPDVVVILGANHTGVGPWFALSGHTAWMTPLGRLPVDTDANAHLLSVGYRQSDATFAREHSIEVQLPFIQHLWKPTPSIVPICISSVPANELQDAARAILDAVGDRQALVIASSDFTHYQPDEMARSLDKMAMGRILALDISGFHQLCRDKELTICGAGAIELLMAVARRLELNDARLVSYATSADVTGDQSSVVGYASMLLVKEKHG